MEHSIQGDALLDMLRVDNESDNVLDIDGLQLFLDDLINSDDTFLTHGAITSGIPHGDPASSNVSVGGSAASDPFNLNNQVLEMPMMMVAAKSGSTMDKEGESRDKKRSRNKEQMEHNRVAQRNYRERKKMENHELQRAVDMLTFELAALKAYEIRSVELERQNVELNSQVMGQRDHIQQLETKVTEQQSIISSQVEQLTGQMALMTSQQKMILDQHQKVQLQEVIIAQLKDVLKESVDSAWESLAGESELDPTVVCRKMHAAVRAALMGAKNVDGLQETLAKLPEQVVVQICKNILVACKDMMPELAKKLGGGGTCTIQSRLECVQMSLA